MERYSYATSVIRPVSMEPFDVFVYVHGFYIGKRNNFIPAEIGFAEIGGNESVSLQIVHLGNGQFKHAWKRYFAATRENKQKNEKMYARVHGIPYFALPSPSAIKYHPEKCRKFQSIDLKFLPDFFKLHIVNRNLKMGCRGSRQKKFLMDMIGGSSSSIVDVKRYFPSRLFTPDPRAPYLHRGFHSQRHEKNCAARIAWTYANVIRRWLADRGAQKDYFNKAAAAPANDPAAPPANDPPASPANDPPASPANDPTDAPANDPTDADAPANEPIAADDPTAADAPANDPTAADALGSNTPGVSPSLSPPTREYFNNEFDDYHRFDDRNYVRDNHVYRRNYFRDDPRNFVPENYNDRLDERNYVRDDPRNFVPENYNDRLDERNYVRDNPRNFFPENYIDCFDERNYVRDNRMYPTSCFPENYGAWF